MIDSAIMALSLIVITLACLLTVYAAIKGLPGSATTRPLATAAAVLAVYVLAGWYPIVTVATIGGIAVIMGCILLPVFRL